MEGLKWVNYMNKEKIEQAVRLFLEGIGEDVNREGLLDTPRRISNMCEEILGGMEDDASSADVRSHRSGDPGRICGGSQCQSHDRHGSGSIVGR